MTDYKNLKLIASSSPHIRSNEDTRSIMLDVIIAMLPALVWAVWAFGIRALAVTCVSVIACVVWEWLYRTLLKKPQSVGDLSAVVTGMLLSFVCPVGVSYYAIIVGAFFSIVVAKQLYGGIGKNFVNPALVGRAALLASFAGSMTTWAAFKSASPIFGSSADVVTAATPMAYLHANNLQGLLDSGVPAETLISYGLEYKYVTLYLQGQLSYEDMREKLATAIHQFAKRQMTWFRGMERSGVRIHWVEV